MSTVYGRQHVFFLWHKVAQVFLNDDRFEGGNVDLCKASAPNSNKLQVTTVLKTC